MPPSNLWARARLALKRNYRPIALAAAIRIISSPAFAFIERFEKLRLLRAVLMLRLSEVEGPPWSERAHALLMRSSADAIIGFPGPAIIREEMIRCLTSPMETWKLQELLQAATRRGADLNRSVRLAVAAANLLHLKSHPAIRELLTAAKDSDDGNSDTGVVGGIFDVRTVFPPHFNRTDPEGLVQLRLPDVDGRAVDSAVTVPLPYDGCVELQHVTIGPHFTVYEPDHVLAVYDLAAHPRHPYVAGENAFVRGSCLAPDKAVVSFAYKGVQHFARAVHLAGRSSNNYFHWIVEYLPRIVNVEDAGVDLDTPLLIPAHLPPSFADALQLVNGAGFPLHHCEPGIMLNVDRLHVPAMISCIVEGGVLPLEQCGALSPRHLRIVRERILNAAGATDSSRPTAKRIYVRRSGQARNIRSERRIRALLERRGLVAVDPGELPFLDQVRLFRDAELIVGATGAAFTNLLFCERQPTVLMMTAPQNVNLTLYATLLHIAGGGLYSFVRGEPVNPLGALNRDQFAHLDFEVTPESIETTFKRLGL